jgi:transcriptional regulator with XRE-family HTH domain
MSVIDLGLEIRILRERQKLSAKELAERVGLSQSQMSRLEKGQRRIDTRVLERIAQALEVNPSYFFRGDEAPSPGVIPPSQPASIGKTIRAERRQRHLSLEELAERVGRPKAVLESIEEGKRPLDVELADRILKALRLPGNYFFKAQQQHISGLEVQVERLNEALAESSRATLLLGTEDGGVEEGTPSVQRQGIPILGTLAQGYPATFDGTGRPVGEVSDFLHIPGLSADGTFALHAVGNSMEAEGPGGFREGDLLIFAGGNLRSKDFGFFRIADEAATFRQVFFDPAGQVRLQPLNLNTPPRVHPREKILGMWRLVGHVARF